MPEKPLVIHSGKEFNLTPAISRELSHVAKGCGIQESAEQQGITKDGVKTRRREIKKALRVETLGQAVAYGIQLGYLHVNLESEPCPEKLSPMEEAILQLYARGYKRQDLVQRYRISDHTVSSHYEGIRQKLSARNMNHAVLRAFELGVFKIDEEIMDPDEQANQANAGLQLAVGGMTLKISELGLKHPRELELIQLISQLETGKFNRGSIFKLGFYEDAPSENARTHAYGRAVINLANKLHQAYGQPVIEKKGVKGWREYYFMQEVAIGPPDELRLIPVAAETTTFRAKPTPKSNKPAAKKVTKARMSKTNPDQTLITPTNVQRQEYDTHLDPATLPELNAEFLQTLAARNPLEVLHNPEVKKSILAIMAAGLPIEYRTRLLVPLRYGVLPDPSRYPLAINRDGKYVKLHQVMQHVPPFQGLDTESVSMITGLTPPHILDTEAAFLRGAADKYPNLKTLLPIIIKQRAAFDKLSKTAEPVE